MHLNKYIHRPIVSASHYNCFQQKKWKVECAAILNPPAAHLDCLVIVQNSVQKLHCAFVFVCVGGWVGGGG